MTLLAFHFLVQACQRITRPGMVELPHRLPTLGRMALGALGAKLAAMFVFMARDTARR
jgi:hypothetical protein